MHHGGASARSGAALDRSGSQMRLIHSPLRYRIEDKIRAASEFCEDVWFDRSRKVHTSRNVELAQAGVGICEVGDGHMYQPARPRHIRRAIRDLPVPDLSPFEYVDLGSGKGRTLFVAAEFPFRTVTGVEFSPLLHGQAEANIRSFRPALRRSGPIVSICANAKDFLFPESRLVLYLFNPFGESTMTQVLGNLARSLERRPRHAFVLLLWPRCQHLIASVPGMHRIRHAREYEIFEAHAGLG